MKLIFATHNQSKVEEMRALLKDAVIEVMSADEAGVTDDVVEDGTTFEENAEIKARFVAQKSKEWAVADDSGCCVEALGGRPGIYSARFAGEGASGQAIIDKLLTEMKDVPEGQRQAWFQTALCLVAPDGKEWMFAGRVDGRISIQPQGQARPKFPYDAVFIPEGHDRSFAEMSLEEKNALSHRGRALAELKKFLSTL